ncbi:MAG: RraA family protein [Hyphomicrobiales bacterium]|nr:RraA family protein [Hyphomicrobiales bacterium]
MIDDPPLLTVRRSFPRPTADQVAAFAGLPTGNVVDAMLGIGAMDGRIKPIGGPAAFCGVAVPCNDGPSDNLATFGALDVVQPGDVIVSATGAFTGTAVIGDLLLGMMKNCGCAAFVTDGLVRDIAGIRAVGLACFAAGVTPNSPVRNGPGTVGLPVMAGGTMVGPGDIVLGDEDGVVVVPFDRIDSVVAMLAIVRAAEDDLEAKVKAGLRIPDFIQSRIDAGLFNEID